MVDASGFDFGTAMIPKEKYTCPAFMEREWAALWTKVWLLACREDAIPEPGDYYVHDVGRESILVVRQQDDTVRAFYNVCQHRGNRVAPPGLGHTDDTLKCGYHHWEYDLSGRISRIPDIETFPQGAPCHGLVELACDSWGSFVWFTMNPEP
ncbi:MAG: Rieske (2Fe-2S) protein, partial [Rhodospirillaceae bacterium]|nr:Rieske (2Fe-2S) protein [Rhodospirillaceae bacterium]